MIELLETNQPRDKAMTIDQIKARIANDIKVERVHASLYPEVREMAAKIGNGNVSRGITKAVMQVYEAEFGKCR